MECVIILAFAPHSRLGAKSGAIGFREWQSIKQGAQICRPVTERGARRL